jgi:hypothetical protein
LVALSVNVTLAPGTTAPVGSVTIPVMVARVESCAWTAGLVRHSARVKAIAVDMPRRSRNILLPLFFWSSNGEHPPLPGRLRNGKDFEATL